MAWALDTHVQAFDGHTKTTLEHVALDTENNSHDTSQDDHCDHGIAHIISLISSTTKDIHPTVDGLSFYWEDSLTSTSLIPPYRPPIL